MVRLYEDSALAETCRKFVRLLDSEPDEEQVQKFLESNPVFFHTFTPIKLIPKPPILTEYKADFAVLNNRRELLLIEIERPALRLLKKDGGVTADLQHAIDQVRNWMCVVNDQYLISGSAKVHRTKLAASSALMPSQDSHETSCAFNSIRANSRTSKNYSYLSAIIGSTRIARRAGI